MTLSKLIDYVTNCDREVYNLMAQADSAPSAEEVAQFEQQIGFSLPKEFQRFLTHSLGGLAVEVDEALWPRPKPGDVGPAWSFCFGVYVLSLSSEAPEWISMQKAWAEMCEQGYPELVPVLRVATDADAYCFTKEGKLVIFRHETPDEPDAVEGSFFDALLYELGELEHRTELKLNEQEIGDETDPAMPKAKSAKAKPAKAKPAKAKPAKAKPAKAKAKPAKAKAKPAKTKSAKAKPAKAKPAKAKPAKAKPAKAKPTKAKPAKAKPAKAKAPRAKPGKLRRKK